MQQLFAIGRELRQAQTQLDADRLRRLPAQREELVAELLDWARRHAAAAGVPLTDAALAEVTATLHAGLVDLAAAAAVMSGHLVRPMSHAGFGPLPQVESAGSTSAAPAPAPAPAPPPLPGPGWDEPGEWRMWPVEDELQRRRERAAASTGDHPNGRAVPWQRASEPGRADPTETVRRAEAVLAEAASVHWQREHDLAEAEAAMEAVRDRQETLEQQRMHLRREKVAAEQDLAAARAAQRAALRAMIDARRALDTAERQLRAPDEPG
jgi:hypothetical protein